MEAIGVLYRCSAGCHDGDRIVQVRGRTTEPILEWMETMRSALQRDYAARSPHCRAVTMEYVKIPINEQGEHGIGEPLKKVVQ